MNMTMQDSTGAIGQPQLVMPVGILVLVAMMVCPYQSFS